MPKQTIENTPELLELPLQAKPLANRSESCETPGWEAREPLALPLQVEPSPAERRLRQRQDFSPCLSRRATPRLAARNGATRPRICGAQACNVMRIICGMCQS